MITRMECKDSFLISLIFCFLICSNVGQAQDPIKIMPLGNSITWGYTEESIPEDLIRGYRYDLKVLLTTSGYGIDFVGSQCSGSTYFNDCQHAGIGGFRDQYVVRLLTDGYDERNGVQILVPPRPYLDEYNPDIILLHIGTNDISHETDAVENQQVFAILNLIDQYEIRSGREVTVFLALIINRKKPWVAGSGAATTSEFNDVIRQMALTRIANGDKIVIVDMEHDAGFLYDATDMIDIVHPNALGYQKMATLWYTSIVNNYNTPPVISPIPDQDLEQGSTSDALLLDNYISDLQDPVEDITWSYEQVGIAELDIAIDPNRRVTVTPLNAEWYGKQTVVFTATDKGINDNDFKSATDTVIYNVSRLTPIDETEGQNEVTVYPDPSTGQLIVVAPDNNEIIDFTLYDITGRPVLNKSIYNSHEPGVFIRTGNLVPGIYIYTIIMNTETYTGKLLLGR